MADRTSKIILCKNMKIDKNYRNVLSYNENDMLSLCQNKAIFTANDFSFIEHGKNVISIEAPYSSLLLANYMAFQNPDYASKWFFAFILKIEYVSDGATLIYFRVDEWSTWFNSITKKKVFTIREHVADDTIGAHIEPEGLETGDYVLGRDSKLTKFSDLKIVIGTTFNPQNYQQYGIRLYNNIPSGIWYSVWSNTTDVANFLTQLATDGKSDGIVTMFLAPEDLAYTTSTGSIKLVDPSGNPLIDEWYVPPSNNALDGYVPVNNKLKCYPYCYYLLTNLVGSNVILKPELWERTGVSNQLKLNFYGVLTNSTSTIVAPYNYREGEFTHAISMGKFPVIAYPTDTYANWIKQQSLNIFGIDLGFKASRIIDAFSLNPAKFISNAFDNLKEEYQRSLVPPSINNIENSSEALTSTGNQTAHVIYYSVEYNYAEKIDNFFKMFGYKVTTLKIPEFHSRQYYNYVEIGEGECIGYGELPQNSLDEINKILSRGVTIWHSEASLGNYDVDNRII